MDLSVLSKSLRREEGTSQDGVDVNAQPEVLEQLSQESVSETQRFISLQVVEAGGQQEIQKNVSTERFPEDRRVTSQTKLMSSFFQQPEASYAAHTGQSGQIVGMIE